jgi:tetratricopeptide (TPR) repeat protein
VLYLELLGNALDSQKKPREAIAAYKRGIKIDPRYPGLHFNLGVTFSGVNKLKDARQELERAIELNPHYTSAHYALAEVYRMDGYRVPAILAYSRVLSLTPGGERAVTSAKSVQGLLNLGVEAKGGGDVNITIDPASKKDLGDFSALEMMAALASGARFLEDKGPMSEHDREAESFATFLTMVSETSGELKRGFVAKVYIAFFNELVKAGHGTAFAHLALAPLELPGTAEWISAHGTEVEAAKEWLRPHPE